MLNLTGPIGAPIFASKPWFFDGAPAFYTNLSAYHPPVPFAGCGNFDIGVDHYSRGSQPNTRPARARVLCWTWCPS